MWEKDPGWERKLDSVLSDWRDASRVKLRTWRVPLRDANLAGPREVVREIDEDEVPEVNGRSPALFVNPSLEVMLFCTKDFCLEPKGIPAKDCSLDAFAALFLGTVDERTEAE